jgi:8-oxo-dGTP pyrophosphatase MutT (NUDIX family)
MTALRKDVSIKYLDEVRKSGLRPQIVCFFVNEGEVLLFYKSQYEIWMTVQGGIDNKESIKDAIDRETEEEVGSEFLEHLTEDPVFLGEGQVEFRKGLHGDRELITDLGEEIEMRGKKYFYFAVELNTKDINFKEIEFDDYFWLNYEAAGYLIEKGKQVNKKILNLEMLEKLNSKKLLI